MDKFFEIENKILVLTSFHGIEKTLQEQDIQFQHLLKWIPYYCFWYNTSPHSEHHYTPFELVFGKQAIYPTSFQNVAKIVPIYNFDNYTKELKFKLQNTAAKARQLLESAKEKRIIETSTSSRPINVTVGEKIWLKKENRRKLEQVYSGPYEITEIKHPIVIIKDSSGNQQEVHKNRIVK